MTVPEGEILHVKFVQIDAAGEVSVLNGQPIYITVDDPLQLFESYTAVPLDFGYKSGQVNLVGKAKILSTTDSAKGSLKIYACLDTQCKTQLSNSPLSVPYSLTVVKSNVSVGSNSNGSQWQTASLIANSEFNLPRQFDTAVDASGNALRVWVDSYNNNVAVWFNNYSPLTGWGTARVISSESTPSTNYIKSPKIKMDSNGNALVVWESGFTSGVIDTKTAKTYPWFAQYINGNGWQAAQRIPNPQGTIDYGSLTFDVNTDGSAFALWSQTDGMWAAKFVSQVGWQTPTKLDVPAPVSLSSKRTTKIGMDAKGNAYAMWTWYEQPMFSSYTASDGWKKSTPIITASESVSGDFNLGRNFAVSADGSVMILYEAQGGTRALHLPANGSQWDNPVTINQIVVSPTPSATLVADSIGGFHVVWGRKNDSPDGASRVYYRRYSIGTGWQASMVMNRDGEYSSRDSLPNIAANGQGNLVVAWIIVNAADGQGAAYAKNFTAAGGWGNIALIGPAANDVGLFQGSMEISLAMGANGTAIASWYLPRSIYAGSGKGIWMNVLK